MNKKSSGFIVFILIALALLLVISGCIIWLAGTGNINIKLPGTVETPAPTAEPTPTPAPAPTPVPTEPPMSVNGDYTPIRSGLAYYGDPNLSMIAGILSDNVVTCTGRENGAYRIRLSSGREGWISGRLLTAVDSSLEAARQEELIKQYCSGPGFAPVETVGSSPWRTTAEMLNMRAEPSTSSDILCSVITNTEIDVLGESDGFYLCRIPGGAIAWAAKEYVKQGGVFVHHDGAVDLRELLPKAVFDLKFTKADENVTGRSLYADVAILEKHTADMLYQAYLKFLDDGYLLMICDAYRPRSAQYELWNAVGNSSYIARPDNFGSWHNYGRAVDITLVDAATGEELEMPTPMHTFDRKSGRGATGEWTDEQRENAFYLAKIMTSCGFNTLYTEWWHFEYSGPGTMLENNLDLRALMDAAY